jgi:hypothetical protein
MSDKLYQALKDLVKLKFHKDANGKDKYYETNQPIVWKNAIEALESSSPSPVKEPGSTAEILQQILKALHKEKSDSILPTARTKRTGEYRIGLSKAEDIVGEFLVELLENPPLASYKQQGRVEGERTFTETEISHLQSAIHKITGDGEVMKLFNGLLGVSAG